MAKILDVQNIAISFSIHGRKLYPVRGVSFDLNEGEAIGIVGESGCGKSVTVQSLTRLIPSPPSQSKPGRYSTMESICSRRRRNIYDPYAARRSV